MFQLTIQQACLLVLILSTVPLALSSGLGLLVAVLQAATQIQEQSIVFTAKILAFSALAYFGGSLGANAVQEFFLANMDLVIALGRG